MSGSNEPEQSVAPTDADEDQGQLVQPSIPRGLHRFTLDLHVHSPASRDWRGGEIAAADLVQTALDKGLDGIAVTDHDTGAWLDDVKRAAAGTSLTIFPGLELSNLAGNQGIHLIVLFPLDATSSDVDRFLTKLGAMSGVGERVSRGEATLGPLQVLDAVLEFEALAVLAHCASSKGALADMRGALRTKIIRHPAVLAAETTAEDYFDEAKAEKRKRVYDLLDGLDSTYGRELAVYQASDNPVSGEHGHSLDGIGARVSHFYAEAPLTLESLRQCFVDRDARIKIPQAGEETEPERASHIVGFSVTGGFLDGLSIDLHTGLTTILGAKGSGKSLLIELLRFALDQQPTHPDIRRDHDHKLSSKLGLHGRVLVRVRTAEGGIIEIEREYNPTSGNPFHGMAIPPAEALRAHFLSQGEVIRVAESEDEQIRFIDSFFDFERYQVRMAKITEELAQLDVEVARQVRARKQRDAGHVRAQELKRDIVNIDKKLKNPVFAKQRSFEAKSRAISSTAEYLASLAAALNDMHRQTELLPVPPEPDSAVAEDPMVKRLAGLSEKARQDALAGMAAAIDKLADLRLVADKDIDAWEAQSANEGNAISAEIRTQGGDLAVLNQQRTRLAQELAKVEAAVAAAQQTAELLTPTVQRRDKLIAELVKNQGDYTAARQDRCAWFEEKSENQIKASVAPGANREQFQQSVLGLKRGSRLSDVDIRTIAGQVEPDMFVRSILRFDLTRKVEELDPIATASGLPRDRIRVLAEFMLDAENAPGYEAILKLQYSSPPTDRPSIQFRTEHGGYLPLEELSTGSKCTAMLVMTLCEGDRPIIVDQPEDSLDIRSIWQDMCLRLRRSKRDRQFVLTTHNSSLAVASDSDMFVVLEASATKGEVVLDGAIDSEDVRAEVIKLLEGGETTYFLKQRKYNIADPYQRRRVTN